MPYGNLENPTLDTFKSAILAEELEPKMPTKEHMPDCPDEALQDLTRLLALMWHHIPDLRPTAEQARRIITKIAKGICPHIHTPLEEDVEMLIQRLEDRMELGNKAAAFYNKYNPSKLKELGKVLDAFEGKEDELNEQMRLRYKADLNGEYPDPEPEIEPEDAEQDFDAMVDVDRGNGFADRSYFREGQEANSSTPFAGGSLGHQFGQQYGVMPASPGNLAT